MTLPTLLSNVSDQVCTLTINRPRLKNAVDSATMLALGDAIRVFQDRNDINVFVITGADGAFCSGADISAIAMQPDGKAPDPASVHAILTQSYAPTLQAIRACPRPVIAAVDGMAAGIGCDLALTCDLRLCSVRAIFAELFIRVGLIPDGGGTYLLPRLVGLGKALEMMFTGENVSAEQALTLGLANKVYPTESFTESVQEYATLLAQQSPQALRRGKQLIYAALGDTTPDQAMAREAEQQRAIFESADGFEGFNAFLEKRPPRWSAR